MQIHESIGNLMQLFKKMFIVHRVFSHGHKLAVSDESLN